MIELLRRNRDIRLLFGAQLVSFMGDWFATVALVGLVLDLTDSELAASLVLVAQVLPAVPLTPLTGAAADRLDRRRLLIIVSLLQAVVALGFLLVGDANVWLGFVVMAAVSGLAAFVLPAAQAAVPNLVDPDDLATATAMMSATWGAMLAIGAALGGAFAAVFGRDAAFVANALSFLAAAALTAGIRRPTNAALGDQGDREGRVPLRPVADTVQAMRYARADHTVLALLASKMGFGISMGTVALLAVFATDVFDAGDGAIGLLYGARGLGVVLGPFLAWRLIRQQGMSGILVACGVASLTYAGAYALVPLMPAVAAAAVFVAVAHLGGGAQWTLSTYGLQVVTPDGLRGRIFAFDFALVTLTMAISLFAAGALADVVGPRPVMYGLVALSATWGTVYLLSTRRLRARVSWTTV